LGHGFIAQNLTIRNTVGPEGRQAVALRSNLNKSVVYRCSIEGHEDTLYVENGIQFYLQTSIWGTMDFVFGNAQAMFQSCPLLVRRPPKGKHNVLTAQGCNNASRESGFSFHMCTVEAAPGVDLDSVETYLDRPYRNFSHVAFIKSYLSRVVSPNGWVAWNKNKVVEDTTRTILYLEYGNDGAGADTAGRVKWPGFHVLNADTEAAAYTADMFINLSKWVPEPIQYDHTLGAAPLPRA
jgi:pectinesterase